jgi:hypothetical protein
MCKDVSNPSRTCRGTTVQSRHDVKGKFFSVAKVETLRYLLTSLMFVSFLEGRVPCRRCATVRRMSKNSAWMDSHAPRLVKGNLTLPSRMSWVVTCRTTESSWRFIKVHIWQDRLLQSAALRLAKSDGKMAWPDTCLMDTWKQLAVARKVDTRGLAENSPLHSFS